MRKTSHSHELTACLMRCVTGHAPIRAYQSRFFPNKPTACRCGFLLETVSHVLRECPSHERDEAPKGQLRYKWLTEFLKANTSAFAFDVH